MVEAPAVEILDPRFAGCIVEGELPERLWTGGKWVEGPAWLSSGTLIWSDIPGNRMLAYEAASGAISTFRQPSGGGNGNTVDREGRLVTCEQYRRRVTRTEPDGSVTVLAERFGGFRFNAPNDVVVRSDGSVWFTDPAYGRSPLYEGELELEGCHIYRVDPDGGAIRQMTHDMEMPNGLAFSPDEAILYAIDTGSTHRKGGPNHIRRFAVHADDTLHGGEVILTDHTENLDGMRVDTEGRLWIGAEDGVRCLLPDGTPIGRIRLGERAANLAFGGADGTRLFMCATTSLYSIRVRARGADWRGPPSP